MGLALKGTPKWERPHPPKKWDPKMGATPKRTQKWGPKNGIGPKKDPKMGLTLKETLK